MKITYSSNNSGGRWWLSDEDWRNLEKAGWKVDWKPNNKEYKDGRFLGALATGASKDFLSKDCAIAEFEAITGQNACDEGCSCCGNPHNFYDDE